MFSVYTLYITNFCNIIYGGMYVFLIRFQELFINFISYANIYLQYKLNLLLHIAVTTLHG